MCVIGPFENLLKIKVFFSKMQITQIFYILLQIHRFPQNRINDYPSCASLGKNFITHKKLRHFKEFMIKILMYVYKSSIIFHSKADNISFMLILNILE